MNMISKAFVKKNLLKTQNIPSYLAFQAFCLKNRKEAAIIKLIIDKGLTYLDNKTLSDLVQVVIDNEAKGIEGIIVETGCALGGSAIAIASAKSQLRQFFTYDVFGMIPAPSEQDGLDSHERYETIALGKSPGIKEGKYYGYEENLYAKVIQSFRDFSINLEENNINLVRGLYEDTLFINQPVSLAHIDCDWYDSVMCCLSRIEPYLAAGGTLVIDDYYHYQGCKDAVDTYFRDKQPHNYRFLKKSRLHIVKV